MSDRTKRMKNMLKYSTTLPGALGGDAPYMMGSAAHGHDGHVHGPHCNHGHDHHYHEHGPDCNHDHHHHDDCDHDDDTTNPKGGCC